VIDPAEYRFELPPDRIAQVPPARRTDARLLAWRPDGFHHASMADLPRWIRPGDLLVLNDTRVFPARLRGSKRGGSAEVEVLLVQARTPREWTALVRPGRRLPPGTAVDLEGGASLTVGDAAGAGLREVTFGEGVDGWEVAGRHGHVPLPPYIGREDGAEDRERYQTVFARTPGSVAAPTAGLHFDEALLAAVRGAGAAVATVTLHVGPGTFRPPTAEQLRDGRLHAEEIEVGSATLDALAAALRVIAVGTTTCRALESLPEPPRATRGATDLFIRPGFRFRFTDVLLTNFHLPGSSLLMLVEAFAGTRWRDAYRLAVEEGYRFYSYGDANWIEREP